VIKSQSLYNGDLHVNVKLWPQGRRLYGWCGRQYRTRLFMKQL